MPRVCAQGTTGSRVTAANLKPIMERVSPGGQCSVETCPKTAAHLGLCNTHYSRRSAGQLNRDRPIKDKAPNGSGWTTKEGNRMLLVDGRRMFEVGWCRIGSSHEDISIE